MSNVSSVVNFFSTANESFATTLSSTISGGATTVPIAGTSGLTNGSIFVGIIEPGAANQQVFTGTVNVSGLTITNVVWTRGSNVGHTAGVTIVDYVTGTDWNMMSTGVQTVIAQTGGLNSGLTIASPTITSPTISNQVSSGKVSGWTLASETWSYASSSTITVPTDATTKYDIGDFVQLTQSSTVKYFIITGVTSTVLTVAGMTPGALETVANAAISLNSYSKARSPHGLPAGVSGKWLSYTPTVTLNGGGSNGNAAIAGSYTQSGKTVSYWIHYTLGSTTSFTSLSNIQFSLPVASSTTFGNGGSTYGSGSGNAGGSNSYGLTTQVVTNTTALLIAQNVSGSTVLFANITATYPNVWGATNSWTITGTYEAA